MPYPEVLKFDATSSDSYQGDLGLVNWTKRISEPEALYPGLSVKERKRKPPVKTQDLGGTLTWEPPEDQSQIEHYAT